MSLKYISFFALATLATTPVLAQRRFMFQNQNPARQQAKAQKQAQNKAARQQQRRLERQQQEAARRAQNQQQRQAMNQQLRQEQPGHAGGAITTPNAAVANPEGGPRLGDWLRQHRGLNETQQRQLLESDPAFRSLPPGRQQNYRQQLEHFNRQTPEQQERILERMRKWESLTDDQRSRARSLFERARQMPEDRRNAMREAVTYFNRMTDPVQRQQAMSSAQYRSRFNDQEREIINGIVELGVPPGRMNPRQEQPQPEGPEIPPEF